MNNLERFEDICIVTAIIPQHHAQFCMEEIASMHSLGAIQFDARGTLSHNSWYQRFLPTVNPEYEYLHYMLPREDVDAFMAYLIKTARLDLPGAGAVFYIPCKNYETNVPRMYCETRKSLATVDATKVHMKTDQTAVFGIMQSGRTDAAIRSAMRAGSHGPIVYFSEGRGTRDQIGWLRITKKPYDEVIMAVVNNVDKDFIVNAIVDAGRINMPGGGLLYEQPVEKGVINLTSTSSRSNVLANERQMVAAIDELMGTPNWRDRRDILLNPALQANRIVDKKEDRHLQLLTVLVSRNQTYPVVDVAMAAGASGANITFAKQMGGKLDRDERTGFTIHQEIGLIRIVIEQEKIADVRKQLADFCGNEDLGNITMYEQDVSAMNRYGS